MLTLDDTKLLAYLLWPYTDGSFDGIFDKRLTFKLLKFSSYLAFDITVDPTARLFVVVA